MPLSPPLNWKEIELLARRAQADCAGLFIERVFVPARERFPEGFIKGEWGLRLSGRTGARHREVTLVMSARPQSTYFYWLEGKSPVPAPGATRSGFLLALSKYLVAARLERVVAWERERIVRLEAREFALILSLVPARPEGILASRDGDGWRILASTRLEGEVVEGCFTPPKGNAPPGDPPVRECIGGEAQERGVPGESTPAAASPERFADSVEAALCSEAWTLRSAAVSRSLREREKLCRSRAAQAARTEAECAKEPDWRAMADALKACLHEEAKIERKGDATVRLVPPITPGPELRIPWNPDLPSGPQLTRLYEKAERNERKAAESRDRAMALEEQAEEARVRLIELQKRALDWGFLEAAEGSAGIRAGEGVLRKDSKRAWAGPCFQSTDGTLIRVGRSRDENLELTFRLARGNDIWLHAKGRPSAHAVVSPPPGKTAALETLLDAAALVIQFSGGAGWGKTEIDYTFRKNVKRIPDSAEASYVRNKTLVVSHDPARLKRLLKPG